MAANPELRSSRPSGRFLLDAWSWEEKLQGSDAPQREVR